MDERQFSFASFRLDPAAQELWDGAVRIPLRPKVFAALHHLLEHAGRLVTRDELRSAVWPATAVSESVVRGVIRELRDVLGDDAAAASFIETVPHRGHRFIAAVTVTKVRGDGTPTPTDGGSAVDAAPIGRAGELARLHHLLAGARSGERRVVFVTGEPGIGKTMLVDAFLAGAGAADVVTARGQCVEHYGAGEAYLPVLEALAQLCRGPSGADTAAVLGRYAPTWLAQMPALIADADLDAVQRRAHGATRERMLRELAEALDALTAAHPLVLALEDLPWSDYSTLDLLSLLAQRRAPARLLVVGTYRPADVAGSGHPLKGLAQELRSHGRCEELPLPLLSEAEVGTYLATRLPRAAATPALARAMHRRTEGNPLFVVNVVDDWLRHGATADDSPAALPENLRQLIDKQLGRLRPDESGLLEVASIAGAEFCSAAVAAALDEPVERVETICEALARREQFLRARATDTLADGSVSGRYAFRHALYQQALYEQVAPARRVRLHRRLGEWEERGPSTPVKERAAQLARHFEQGREPGRAIAYLGQAADNAMRRQGPHEAVALLKKSLNLLRLEPDTGDRAPQELALLVTLGVPLLMTRGYAAAEVERTYAQAHRLCQRLCDSPQLLPALAGLFRFAFVRADFATARELGAQILRLAEQTGDPLITLVAHSLMGVLLLSLGEFAAAHAHLQAGIRLYDPAQHGDMAALYGDDPGVTCHCFAAMCLWLTGFPDQALATIERSRAVARALDSPYADTFALDFATWIHVLRRDERAAQATADALLPIAVAHGFEFLRADSDVLRGWALAAQGNGPEGLRRIEAGIASYEATGARMSRPAHLWLLARAHAANGNVAGGLAAVAEALALVEQTSERTYEAELYRLRGELLLRSAPSDVAAAEACFRIALDTARRQGAKSLELRAATCLARLYQEQGKAPEARQLMDETYGWFTEGFDTADLVEARALLETSDRG